MADTGKHDRDHLTSAPLHHHISGSRLALAGMASNLLLAAVKLLAGILGHSNALIADAIESLTDIVGSLVVWSGIRIASQPPDEKHPYGHGRAETLAALIVAMILAAAGISVAIAAVNAIITPSRPPAMFTLWVLIFVVVVKEALYQIGRRLSERSGSGVVLADALHHRSDAITSVAAFIGISVAIWGGPGFEIADGIAAMFASLIILYNAGRLARAPIHELMETKSPELVSEAKAIAQGVAGVQAIEKVLARQSGMHSLIDMHVQVDPEMPVREAHAVAHRVKDAVRAKLPRVLDVLVHIEPFDRS